MAEKRLNIGHDSLSIQVLWHTIVAEWYIRWFRSHILRFCWQHCLEFSEYCCFPAVVQLEPNCKAFDFESKTWRFQHVCAPTFWFFIELEVFFFLNSFPFFLTLFPWFNQRFPVITLVASAVLTTVRLLNLLFLRKVLRVLTWITLQTPPMPSSAERSELPLCQPPCHSDHNRPPVGALLHRCYLAFWHPLCLGKETIKMSLTEN